MVKRLEIQECTFCFINIILWKGKMCTNIMRIPMQCGIRTKFDFSVHLFKK